MNKRQVALGELAGLVGGSLVPVSASAGGGVSEADVRAALLARLEAAIVANVLAPEFQIQRSDGSSFVAHANFAQIG